MMHDHAVVKKSPKINCATSFFAFIDLSQNLKGFFNSEPCWDWNKIRSILFHLVIKRHETECGKCFKFMEMGRICMKFRECQRV